MTTVPSGWCIKTLEQVARIRAGLALGKTRPVDPVRLPYLRVANVQAGWLDLRNVKTVLVERAQIDRYLLHVGDVLMTEGGDIDKLGRGDVWQGAITPCLHQNHIFAVQTDPSQLLPEYLNALTGSAYGRRYFSKCAKRSTSLASINSTQVKNFPVLLPPLVEQQAIVEVLTAWNAAIGQVGKMLANTRAQKAALMQHFFGRANTRAWPRAAISELARINVASLKKTVPPDFEFRYITLTDVNECMISASLPKLKFAKSPTRARRIIHPGNILVSTVRPNLQGYARVTEAHADCIASTGFAVLAISASKPIVSVDYLFHYLFCADFQHQIKAQATGSSYPILSPAHLGKLRIAYPPPQEQADIAKLLNTADARIAAEIGHRDLLIKEKCALIQQLLTGKQRVRLPHPPAQDCTPGAGQ